MAFYQIPLSNTLRMVRTDNQGSNLQNFDNRLLHQEDYPYYFDRPYLQKVSSADSILIQFSTDQGVPTAEVYDHEDNLISDKSGNISTVLTSTTFTIYNLSFTVAVEGIYYLQLTWGTVIYKSNYFQIDGFDEDRLVKIEYNTSETDGINYTNSETFVVRLESRLAEYQPEQNKESYTSFDETLVNLKSYPIRKVVLEFGPIPRFMVEKLNLALSHEVFKINDVEYQAEEFGESNIISDANVISNMYNGSVTLQQVDYEKYTEATEDQPEDTFFIEINEDDNLLEYNDSGDLIIYKS
jgi:hypothetical protein